MATKLNIAIVGSSGYTGGELYRLLLQHPAANVTAVTSEKSAGQPIATIFPQLAGLTNLICEPLNYSVVAEKADIIFLALPHATAQKAAFEFHQRGKKVIDLSADFRLADPAVYQEWYEHPHEYPSLLKEAVYGLPELERKKIAKATLIANPGCYPTGAILGLAPLLAKGVAETQGIIIDSKSGVSGAGRTPGLPYHYPEANEGLTAYKIGTHRHTPEIEQALAAVAGTPVRILFTPHLIPMNRGILSTLYATPKKLMEIKELYEIFSAFYANERFVRLLTPGQLPNVRNVRGSNFCDIGLTIDQRSGRIVVVTAIDNLVKGAAGQAIQNMNIMCGLEETTGLLHAGMFP